MLREHADRLLVAIGRREPERVLALAVVGSEAAEAFLAEEQNHRLRVACRSRRHQRRDPRVLGVIEQPGLGPQQQARCLGVAVSARAVQRRPVRLLELMLQIDPAL